MPLLGRFKVANKSSKNVICTVAPQHWCDAPGNSTRALPPGGLTENLGMQKSASGGADGKQAQFLITLSRPPITKNAPPVSYGTMTISFDGHAQPFTLTEVPFLNRLHFVDGKDGAWQWDTDVDTTFGEPFPIKSGKLILVNKSVGELTYSVTPDYGCKLPKEIHQKNIKANGHSEVIVMEKLIAGGANAVFSVNLSLKRRGEETNYRTMKISFDTNAKPYTLAEVPYLSEIHKIGEIWYWEFDVDKMLPKINT